MRWQTKAAVVMCGVVSVSVSVAMADGFRNAPDGATALGRVARIVQIDDATAVTHNPANLVDIKQPMVEGSVVIGYAEKKFTSLTGESSKSKDPWNALPNAYGVAPIDDSGWVVGVGVNAPFGQSIRWDKTSIPGAAGPYYARMTTIDVNPTVATKIGSRLSVGVGLDVYWSQLDFRQIAPWSVMLGNPLLPNGTQKLKGDGYAVGGNVGATWRLTDHQRVSVTYRSSFDVDYEGDFDVDNIPAPLAMQGIAPRSDFDTQISFPAILGFGYGIDVTDTIRLEADAEWAQHSVFDELSLDLGADNALLPPSSSTIPQDWKDTWSYSLGGDWHFAPAWTFRAGYTYIESPVPSKTLMASVAEQDQSVVGVGLGYKKNAHRIDLAYDAGIFDTRKIRGNQNPAFNGDYNFVSHLVGISYGYSF